MDTRVDQCGRVKNFFDPQQVQSFITYMKYLPSRPDAQGNSYHVISFKPGHELEWFKTNILSLVNKHFGTNSQLVFAEMIDCRVPGNVHHDIKPLPTYHGQHWLTFMIPVDVNDNPNLCSRTSTMIFRQNIGRHAAVLHDRLYEEFPVIEDNVRHLAQGDLQHVTPHWLSRLSVLEDLSWSSGDLLWWGSGLAHCSTDLAYRGVDRKRSIIFFTYVDR